MSVSEADVVANLRAMMADTFAANDVKLVGVAA